jgi:hypothetical protein
MSALTMKRIAGLLAAAAVAAAVAGAPQAGMAMGGGRGGSNDIGFEGASSRGGAQDTNSHSGEAREAAGTRPARRNEARDPTRIHEPQGSHRVGDYFQDAQSAGDPVIYGAVPDAGRPYDPAFADHRLIGQVFDEVRRDWPVDFLFGPQMYGAGDFQHCTRRDVYGDLYRAC